MKASVEAERSKGSLTDRFGAVASSLCAIHCAICALAPALFGALGLGVLLSHEVELGLASVAILFGLGAMVLAWRQHQSKLVMGLLALGVIGLVVSRGLEMGSDHEHHGEAHHGEVEHADKGDKHADKGDKHADKGEKHADKGDKHADEGDKHEEGHHDEHEDFMHAFGAGTGVLAGGLLALGHLFNLKATRRRREADECCD